MGSPKANIDHKVLVNMLRVLLDRDDEMLEELGWSRMITLTKTYSPILNLPVKNPFIRGAYLNVQPFGEHSLKVNGL